MLQLVGVDNAHAEFIVKRLADLRQEMEKGMPGGRLRILSALVIFDVCNALGLTPQERLQVLGPQNDKQVDKLINTPIVRLEKKARPS